MNETNKIGFLIAFVVVVVVLFLFFGGGAMNGGMMGRGMMGGISWMWIPTLLILGIGMLLSWVIFGKK